MCGLHERKAVWERMARKTSRHTPEESVDSSSGCVLVLELVDAHSPLHT